MSIHTVFRNPVVRLAAGALLIVASALAQDPVVLDPKHYIVEVDNERVRALRVRYGLGEGSPMHHHPPGVGITMTATKSRFTMPDGSTREGGNRPRGVVFWRAATRHANVNLTSEAAEMIEIDLKGVPNRPVTNVAGAPPAGSMETVELENEFVRVVRLRIPPKARTSVLRYPDRVAVVMGDQTLRWTEQGNKWRERTLSDGQVLWMPAGAAESVENLGATVAESFLVELKPLQK